MLQREARGGGPSLHTGALLFPGRVPSCPAFLSLARHLLSDAWSFGAEWAFRSQRPIPDKLQMRTLRRGHTLVTRRPGPQPAVLWWEPGAEGDRPSVSFVLPSSVSPPVSIPASSAPPCREGVGALTRVPAGKGWAWRGWAKSFPCAFLEGETGPAGSFPSGDTRASHPGVRGWGGGAQSPLPLALGDTSP